MKTELLARILAAGVEPIEMLQIKGIPDSRKLTISFCGGKTIHWRFHSNIKNSLDDAATIASVLQIIESLDPQSISSMFELTDRGQISTLLFSREEIERAKLIHEQVMLQLN